ncbi:MAG: radical SAM protein [Acidobacteria bacterium]|nr:MAG: radical SAM protein [Acidobacteriota bacterium]REK01190.1 MAG: radical SAM protein [Acidobacteriota bacterium]REK14146.1 MAG: radical SAM protein [Acidobacteriota bacterium]REK44861.1 MAG: radical SAM protein [Acidobacteriota bacterium]
MSLVSRIGRHTRLSMRAVSHKKKQTPPFMIVFINSICNLTCEHCFYWQNLNKRDDLTFEEFEKLSLELGEFENLNLSGGEPFIRKDFAEVCELFIKNNGVKNIYVPTNGYFTDRTEKALRKVLEHESLELFVCELSLDGMPEYHNEFRGNPRSFEKAMETYEMLAELQKEHPKLRIHANTVAMSENMDEAWQLTEYLFNNCPKMEHHNLAIIRGDRKNPSLQGPQLEKYKELYRHVSEVWSDREKGRFGSSVEPMLQWAKVKTIEAETQFVPCKAGILTGVVYANGDVSVCEEHLPLGNLREKSFFEIWDSEEAQKLRAKIKAKACWCTNEIFMWSSIVFQPVQLTRAMVGAKTNQIGTSKTEAEKV